jgi:hypothetical protein
MFLLSRTVKLRGILSSKIENIIRFTGIKTSFSYTYDANGNRKREDRRSLPADAEPLESDTYAYKAGTNRRL